jgi:intraflagellar transport protein 81
MTAEGVFSKLEQELRVNKFFASVNLPKALLESSRKLEGLRDIIERDVVNESDLVKIEREIEEITRVNSDLAERLKMNGNGDVNLGLVRQQSLIVSTKRDDMATRLQKTIEECNKLQTKVNESSQQLKGPKMLVGEEFQKYVNDLRAKSVKFKHQKAEFESISTELNILSRTKEVKEFG